MSNSNHPEEPEEWLRASIIFARALGLMLQETEGVVVTFEDTKCIVFRRHKEIVIQEADLSDPEIKDAPDGTMIWLHDDNGLIH